MASTRLKDTAHYETLLVRTSSSENTWKPEPQDLFGGPQLQIHGKENMDSWSIMVTYAN